MEKQKETSNNINSRFTDNEPQIVPNQIKNPSLYIKIRDVLRKNIDLVNKHKDTRKRTRKIYSQEVNVDILEMIYIAIIKEDLNKEVQTLGQLNGLYLACQRTYDEVTEKKKKIIQGEEAIKNKIMKFEGQMAILNSQI